MKGQTDPHWALLELAEREAPAHTIDLWPRIAAQLASGPALDYRRRRGRPRTRWLALGPALVVLLALLLACVPGVRALAGDVIQRMGIAFLDTEQHQDESATLARVEATRVTPPPSLSIAEIRGRISFPLRVPTWLPDDLTYVHGSISEYDPTESEGSGQKVTIAYYRTTDHDFGQGALFLSANDGPIGAPPLLAESRQQQVLVNGEPGIYVHGGWRDDGRGDPNTSHGILQWDDQADDAYLTWSQDGVTYLLEAHNLGLDLEDLQRICSSMVVE